MMPSIEVRVAGRSASHASSVRPPQSPRVENSEHRDQRQEQVAADQDEDRPAGDDRARRRSPRVIAATATPALEERVQRHDDRDDDDHPRASALPTFAWPRTTSLVSASRIWSGTIGLPWLTSAAAVA